MKLKNHPAPWTLSPDSVTISCKSEAIAAVYGSVANARLICAAPELLNSCLAMQRLLEEAGMNNEYLDNAIKKALGI